MSAKKQKNVPATEEGNGDAGSRAPRCLAIAQGGITTANQFARFMSGLISDLIDGSISPQVSNAAVNAGGKLLKVVEMQYKYGRPNPQDGSQKTLSLVTPESEEQARPGLTEAGGQS